MRNLREAIRAIIRDDALYKRKDLPGDADEPEPEQDCNCGCSACSGKDDYVTPKYALYSMIGDAISVYDKMDGDSFDDDEENELIMRMAEVIHHLNNE